ncbi:spore coat protein U domain-containing protein [Variovorax sp. 38R]|nr:spore coat protein U domain-containing protein [Variovorax sp. 38R]
MRHLSHPLLRALARTVLPVGALLALAPSAQAASATTTFQVTATVLKACLMSTPATLAFGPYDPASATALAGTTSLNVTCTFGTPYSIGLSAGGGTVTNRLMTSTLAAAGNNTLNYGLFKDSAHLNNWDDSIAGTGYVGNGVIQPQTIYGLIPTAQYAAAPATDYSDTITVTLTY